MTQPEEGERDLSPCLLWRFSRDRKTGARFLLLMLWRTGETLGGIRRLVKEAEEQGRGVRERLV